MNLCPEGIHRFIWSAMIRVISDHWSWSWSSQRNTPFRFWIPCHEFGIRGTGLWILCQWNSGSGFQSLMAFRIPWAVAVFQIPSPGFRILQQKFAGFLILPDGGILWCWPQATFPLVRTGNKIDWTLYMYSVHSYHVLTLIFKQNVSALTFLSTGQLKDYLLFCYTLCSLR